MGEAKEGLAAAVDLLMVDHEGTFARREEQLSLIPTPAALDDVQEAAKEVGRGRPRGARNRATEDMVAFIRARYRDPRLFLAETFNRPVEQLAKELGTTREKAFGLQVAAATALLPYVAQKQPQAIQLSTEGEVTLVISTAPLTGQAVIQQGLIIDLEDEEKQ